MREFLRGWRRKVGLVTLVMACVLMGGWIRSRMIADLVVTSVLHRTRVIVSSQSQITVWGRPAGRAAIRFEWTTSPTVVEHQIYVDDDGKEYSLIDFNGGFMFMDDTSPWVVHYAMITLPLSLLSAYLILWKPRKQPVH